MENVPVTAVLIVPDVIAEVICTPFTNIKTVDPALAVPVIVLVAVVNAVGVEITGAINGVELAICVGPLPAWQTSTGSD